jgi:hypothetical protein
MLGAGRSRCRGNKYLRMIASLDKINKIGQFYILNSNPASSDSVEPEGRHADKAQVE